MRVHSGKFDGQVMSIATPQVLVASESDTLAGIKTMMETWHIHHLPVVENNEVVGIVSTNDIRVAEQCVGVIPHKVTVNSFMQCPVITITTETSISDAAALMISQNIHCLPILDDTKIAGIVTQTDLLRHLCGAPPDP